MFIWPNNVLTEIFVCGIIRLFQNFLVDWTLAGNCWRNMLLDEVFSPVKLAEQKPHGIKAQNDIIYQTICHNVQLLYRMNMIINLNLTTSSPSSRFYPLVRDAIRSIATRIILN